MSNVRVELKSKNKKNISEIFDSSEKVLDEEIPTLHGYGWISRVLNNENSLVRIVMTRTKAMQYTGTNRNWNSPQKYLKKKKKELSMTLSHRTILYIQKQKLFPLMSFFLACWLMNKTAIKWKQIQKTAQLNFQIKRTHAHF